LDQKIFLDLSWSSFKPGRIIAGQSSPVNLIHSIITFKPFILSEPTISDCNEMSEPREELYHDHCLGFGGVILNQKIFFVNEIFLTDKWLNYFSLSRSQLVAGWDNLTLSSWLWSSGIFVLRKMIILVELCWEIFLVGW